MEQHVFQQDVFESDLQTVSDYLGTLTPDPLAHLDDEAESGVDAWGDLSGNPLLREIRSLRYMLYRKYEAKDLPAKMDMVGWVLEAVRVGDTWRAYLLLMDVAFEEDLIKLQNMPATQLGELFECLDPLRVHERVDVLANLRFSPAMRGYGFADHLIDKFGVRRIYGTVLDVLGPIIEDRVMAREHITPPAVFSTLFRLAGAASLPQLAYMIRDLAGEAAKLWTDKTLDAFSSGDIMLDYLRTMFLTEPVYYQHDKTRVRVRPRHMPSSVQRLRFQQIHRLEALNMHNRAIKSHSFGLNSDDALHDLQRWIGNHKRMEMSMPISRLLVCGPSEDIACAALVGSAASGTSEVIKRLLFMFWGVKVTASGVTGGEKISPESALRPTEKVLKAVARALGGSNEIRMAMRVISHMSSHFDIPVPREVWSELLEFAHIHGAYPARVEWKYADDPRGINTSEEIPAVMGVLQKKHGFTLDFKDHLILARNLIGAGDFNEALRPLREAKAIYEEMRAKVETAAVAAAAAQAQKMAMPSYVSRDLAFRHLTMEREVKRHDLMTACREWFVKASRAAISQEGWAPEVIYEGIPRFVLEFFDLLPQRIQYGTPTGTILFHHPVPRVTLRKEWMAAPDVVRNESVKVLLSEYDKVENYREFYAEKHEEVDTEEEEALEGVVDGMMTANAEADFVRGTWNGSTGLAGAGGEQAGATDMGNGESEDMEDVLARITGVDTRETGDETNAESTAEKDAWSAGTESTGVPGQAGAESYVDKLVARRAGSDAADMDRLLAQNMGAEARPEDENPDGDSREAPDTQSFEEIVAEKERRRRERHMTPEEIQQSRYRERVNEGRGTVWEWVPEQVIVRSHGWVNVRTPVPRPRLGPEGREKWDVEGRALWADGGAVMVEEVWQPGMKAAAIGASGKVEEDEEAGVVEGTEPEPEDSEAWKALSEAVDEEPVAGVKSNVKAKSVEGGEMRRMHREKRSLRRRTGYRERRKQKSWEAESWRGRGGWGRWDTRPPPYGERWGRGYRGRREGGDRGGYRGQREGWDRGGWRTRRGGGVYRR